MRQIDRELEIWETIDEPSFGGANDRDPDRQDEKYNYWDYSIDYTKVWINPAKPFKGFHLGETVVFSLGSEIEVECVIVRQRRFSGVRTEKGFLGGMCWKQFGEFEVAVLSPVAGTWNIGKFSAGSLSGLTHFPVDYIRKGTLKNKVK